MLEQLVWLGHDGFFYRGSPRVYVDPFRIESGPPADLVLITHCHFDHCSPEDVAKVATGDTVLICPPDCAACLRGLVGEILLAEPGFRASLLGVKVEAVPAYTRRRRLHGRANGWVGYLLEADGGRWYHAGDTDFIPEMQQIRADVACLPVCGGTVMNPVEAAAAADCIGPGVAVPMHYGKIVGRLEDAEEFRERASVEVRILEPEAPE